MHQSNARYPLNHCPTRCHGWFVEMQRYLRYNLHKASIPYLHRTFPLFWMARTNGTRADWASLTSLTGAYKWRKLFLQTMVVCLIFEHKSAWNEEGMSYSPFLVPARYCSKTREINNPGEIHPKIDILQLSAFCSDDRLSNYSTISDSSFREKANQCPRNNSPALDRRRKSSGRERQKQKQGKKGKALRAPINSLLFWGYFRFVDWRI